jgi:Zn-dependent alcohol dehydrogenase
VQAYWSLGIGGTLIQAGIPPMETTTPLPLTLTPPHNRNILGTLYGNVRIAYDLPRFMDMILRGDYIDLAKLIGRKFKLEEINDVHRAMANHEIIGRWVCEFD